MVQIVKITKDNADAVAKMYIELKKENFHLNHDIFNSKRKKIKPFNEISNKVSFKIENHYFWYMLIWKDEKAAWYVLWHCIQDNFEDDIYENVQFKIWIIDNIYLHPQYRGEWYWKQLFEEIKTEFTHQGCEVIELTTNTNSPALSFYEKLWFEWSAISLCGRI